MNELLIWAHLLLAPIDDAKLEHIQRFSQPLQVCLQMQIKTFPSVGDTDLDQAAEQLVKQRCMFENKIFLSTIEDALDTKSADMIQEYVIQQMRTEFFRLWKAYKKNDGIHQPPN